MGLKKKKKKTKKGTTRASTAQKASPRAARAPWRATLAPTVDAYLAALPPAPRAALGTLRERIRAAAPRASERISYRIPTFEHCGPLVAFSASPEHCALHLMSPALARAHAAELSTYEVGTATIRFPTHAPLPARLVTKLVKARIAENESRAKG
jgi:uncharacterized protein YdhG (YjbR/CyaY superfamily)